MLANQQMLVRQGIGVILVPAAANAADAAWLAHANPLPAPWEDALRRVSEAMHDRVDLPAIEVSEAEAAARNLAKGDFVVAHERAQRAVVQHVAAPEKRSDLQTFQSALALYMETGRELETARREFLAPGARFAVVVEPLFSRSATPLGQDILFACPKTFLLRAKWHHSLCFKALPQDWMGDRFTFCHPTFSLGGWAWVRKAKRMEAQHRSV